MQMRPSKVLRKMRAGNVASCIKNNIADTKATEIAAMCGFDCVWLDMEHIANDWATIDNQIISAKLHDCDTLVRVAKGCYSDFIKPLELDAAGIMVPHLMSAEEAKKVAWQTKFHPVGRRPVDGGGADGGYSMIDPLEYIETANRERFVVVQIEDPEPLGELDEIAEVQGIDMLFFGPVDFSHGLGKFGQWDTPEISDAQKRIAEVAIKHNKFAGTIGGPANLDKLISLGYQFISVGADVVGLSKYYQELVAAFGETKSGTGKSIY